MPKIKQKTLASKKALSIIEKKIKKKTTIALGSGTTMAIFVKLIGKSKIKDKIKAIPSSEQIKKIAKKAKIKVINKGKPKIAIDGLDQISGNLILKGHGALAFVKEKELDYKAKEVFFIADKSKISKKLTLPVLIELKKKNLNSVKKSLSSINAKVIKQVKHNNNIILFLKLKKITKELEQKLNKMPGIIDNGIFYLKKKELITE